MLRYFKKAINPDLRYSLVPFYAITIYMLANLSNSISIFRAYFVLLIAIVCGSLVALGRRYADKQLKDTTLLAYSQQQTANLKPTLTSGIRQ